MSYARVRRQETKFCDATAIGQSAEGVVAARGDEDDLHSAIRRYYFEVRLERMPSHRVFFSKCSRIKPVFQPRGRFLPNHLGRSALTDHSAFWLADQLTSTNSLSKKRVNRGRGILSRWHFEVICAVRVAHAAPWAKCPLCWSSGFIRAAPQPSDDLSLHVVLNDYGELGPPTAVEPAIPPPATHSQWCDSFLLPYRC